VDSGSYCNCYSSRLVDKLSLTIKPRPKHYKLQWINNDGGIVVKDQVSVKIFIGKYEEQVICDVVPIEVRDILLGRPWNLINKLYITALPIRLVSSMRERKLFFILLHLNT